MGSILHITFDTKDGQDFCSHFAYNERRMKFNSKKLLGRSAVWDRDARRPPAQCTTIWIQRCSSASQLHPPHLQEQARLQEAD